MANGNGHVVVRSDTEKFAALDERVTNLRSSFQALEHSTAAGFGRLDAKLNEMAAAIATGQQTPWAKIWPGVSIGVVVIGMIVAMLYWPIRGDQDRLETSLGKVADALSDAIKEGPDTYVPRREIETSRQRAAEDRVNTLASITDLRVASLPRNEWLLRNATVDREFEDVRRTVEQIRADFGGTYSLRDALVDLKTRLERIESEKTH